MARFRTALALGAVLLAVSSPALANGSHHGGGHHGGGAWQGGYPGAFPGGVYYPVMPYQGVYTVNSGYPQSYPQPYPQGYSAPDPHWQDMMERCSQGREHADSGVGGAVIGGIVGGVVGNRVADGDRTLGTVAGAAIGAVAGAAIDKGEDSARMRDLREECDAFFAQHQGYAPGAGYGYPGYVMVPVMLQAQKPCFETTTVTEEWVNVPTRRRVIHRRAAPHHDKRVKEKRVYTGS